MTETKIEQAVELSRQSFERKYGSYEKYVSN